MEWQPIETAPKDQTFLVYLADEGFSEMCRWRADESAWWIIGMDAFQDDFECWHHMTHWQPMPTPPAQAIEAGTG